MDIDQASAILSKLLDERDDPTLGSVVVRLTPNGLVYDTPHQFAADEVAALAVWVREATRLPGAASAWLGVPR